MGGEVTTAPAITGEGEGRGPGSGPTGQDPLLGEIRRRIDEAKRYPLLASRSGVGGSVGIEFRIDLKGQPAEIRIAQSSGHPILDEEAVETIRRAAPFPSYKGKLPVTLRFDPR